MNNEQSAKPNPKSKIQNPKSKTPIVLILIILIAVFLRFFQLPALPPGLNFDEAGNGVAALDILQGTPKLWWPIGGGKEPLWPYLIALSTIVLGNIPLALRLPAALAGLLTTAVVYPLMAALFRGRQGQMIALLTTLGLALSSWHLHFSRLGFRAILLPLLSTLAFYFLWRGLAADDQSPGTNSRLDAASRQRPIQNLPSNEVKGPKSKIQNPLLSALFIALAIYAYLAARLLPLIPLLFFTLHWLIHHLHHWRSKTFPKPGQMRFAEFFLLRFFAFLLLFLSPLIIYFLFNPADLMARSAAVSIFDPTWNKGDLIGTAWRTLTATFGTFIGLSGDANPLVNLPGRPALPPLLAPFFFLGLMASLYRVIGLLSPAPHPPRSPVPAPAPSPHLFLLCWWTVMLLPAILAPEGAPHHLRLIGTIVPTYAFVALGLITIAKLLAKILPSSSHLTFYVLPISIYLLVALQTYTAYFIHWPAAVDFTLPFDLYAVRLAGDIAQPGATYVLPMDIRAGAEACHYSLDYLLAHLQPAPYTYIPVDERNAETLLTQAAAGKDELRVVRWTADKHHQADAKEIVTYLLETTAHLLGRQSFPVYDIETYTASNVDSPDCNSEAKNNKSADCNPHSFSIFALPAIDQALNATFDDRLKINAAFVQPAASPGDWLPVALTLAPLAPMDVDYKASLRLLSPTGRRLAQKDRALRHNFHQGTSLWPPETVNEYYLLPIPPETPPGEYIVAVVIYHPDSQTPLVAGGLVEVPLGKVKVE